MCASSIRQAALLLPPLRRLDAGRDAALARLSEMETELARLRPLPARLAAATAAAEACLAARSAAATRSTLDAMLAAALTGRSFRTRLSGAPLALPAETLRTMVHCIDPQTNGILDLWVETAHLTWMQDRMAPGGTFLDIGSSTGATSLPTAHRFGGAVSIIAYEPATPARALLEPAGYSCTMLGHVLLCEAAG